MYGTLFFIKSNRRNPFLRFFHTMYSEIIAQNFKYSISSHEDNQKDFIIRTRHAKGMVQHCGRHEKQAASDAKSRYQTTFEAGRNGAAFC